MLAPAELSPHFVKIERNANAIEPQNVCVLSWATLRYDVCERHYDLPHAHASLQLTSLRYGAQTILPVVIVFGGLNWSSRQSLDERVQAGVRSVA